MVSASLFFYAKYGELLGDLSEFSTDVLSTSILVISMFVVPSFLFSCSIVPGV